jgi:hypothetical protein
MQELVISLDPQWLNYVTENKIPVYYEVWQPDGITVFCFDAEGNPRWPYESAALDMLPAYRDELPSYGDILLFKRHIVARFDDMSSGICLRVYMHLHPSPHELKERVPHHMATAYLTPRAPFASALYRHGDIGFMAKVPTYGTASLGNKPVSSDPYYTPHEITDVLERVFKAAILPDRLWLERNLHRMHETMRPIGKLLHFTSISTLPVLTSCDRFGDAKTNRRFMLSSGAPGCTNWQPTRGRLQPPVTLEWLDQSMTQAIMLRGLHSREHWVQEGFVWDDSGSESEHYQRQFIAVVNACLLGDNPKKPHASQTGKMVLHAWARNAINDVVIGAGAHVSTRRYVWDHVHYWEDGELKTNMETDENNPAFAINGDCEDQNEAINIIIVWILRQTFKSAFLKAVQVCLAIAGVPCVIAGTARSASTDANNEADAGHVFGFSVPHRIMVQLLWGDTVKPTEILDEVNYYLKSRGHAATSLWVLQCIQPHVHEATMRGAAEYVDRDVLKQDNDMARFEVFLETCKHYGAETILADYISAPYPFALPHTDAQKQTRHRHGFLTHGHVLRMFVCLVDEIDPKGFVGPAKQDFALDYTIAFIPVHKGELGMPIEHLHDKHHRYRLVSMTRLNSETLEDVAIVTAFDRPFVPLDATAIEWKPWLGRTPRGPIAEFEKDTATYFVFADRVTAKKTRLILRTLETRLKPLSVTTRRFGWCVVVIFNFA